MERRRVRDGKKTKRLDPAAGGKAQVELPLHFGLHARPGIGAAGEHRERCLCRTAGPFVALPATVEHEPGEAQALELAPDARFEPRHVERLRQRDHVHRIVRMHFAPAHHRRLKQVEPAFHSAPLGLIAARRALISRCASMHQCFLTLYQMSAACTMLALSMSGPSGSAGCAVAGS